MATFYQSLPRSAQSGSTVKLIRKGKVFADTTDVYTGVWNSTTSVYEFALDDTTFVQDYYRIEDGPGNIIIKDYPVKANIVDKDNIEDGFVKNDADDGMLGELAIQPSGGTDTRLRVGNESATVIKVSAENAASSADRELHLVANKIVLETRAAADIILNGLANGVADDDAVNMAQLNAVKGVGYSAGTLKSHEDSINLILGGTGTFGGTETIVAAATGRRTGIALNWAMNNSTAEAKVRRYEVYIATAQLGSYSSGVQDATELANIQSNMQRINLGFPRDRTAFIHTDDNYYIVILSYDYLPGASGTCIGSTQLYAESGIATDSLTPLIPSASLVDGLQRLAAIVDSLNTATGGGYGERVCYLHQITDDATGGSDVAALVEFTETTGTEYVRCRGRISKDSLFTKLQAVVAMRTSNAAQVCSVNLKCGGLTANATSISTSVVGERKIIELDLSSLADGQYEVTLTLKGTGTGTQYLLPDRIALLPVP